MVNRSFWGEGSTRDGVFFHYYPEMIDVEVIYSSLISLLCRDVGHQRIGAGPGTLEVAKFLS